MSQNGEQRASGNQDGTRVASILRMHGLTHCPHCQTPLSVARVVVGWNTRADGATPRGPMVWMTCTPCGQHIKQVYLPYFAESLDDALEALEDG